VRVRDLLARPFGREWDDRTGSYVRRGWPAERAAIEANAIAHFDQHAGGTCLDCGLKIGLHGPERVLRTGPDLCALARSKAFDA
jgi:hypothetical protein